MLDFHLVTNVLRCIKITFFSDYRFNVTVKLILITLCSSSLCLHSECSSVNCSKKSISATVLNIFNSHRKYPEMHCSACNFLPAGPVTLWPAGSRGLRHCQQCVGGGKLSGQQDYSCLMKQKFIEQNMLTHKQQSPNVVDNNCRRSRDRMLH